MKACDQTNGQNILQHGLSVWRFTNLLLNKDYSKFKLPEWWEDYSEEIFNNLYDRKTIKHYTIWHDCGKPQCLHIDDDGKRHFPNHAEISYTAFKEAVGSKYPFAAALIKYDMLLHTASFDEILALNVQKEAIATLLISALAELHSNANMFGGLESTSFKIKWKKYCKLGLKLCQRYFKHDYCYVVVRKDLSKPQQAVQSGHAILEMARKLEAEGHHPSIIICGADDEDHLLELYDEYKQRFDCHLFHEPDIGNQATAFCVSPIQQSNRKFFRKLQLLK